MNTFLLNILLAVAWISLTGEFTPSNFMFGFLGGYFMMWVTSQATGSPGYWTKGPRIISFGLFFFAELIVANVRVVMLVLNPRLRVRPAVVAVPLDARSDLEITLLANLITLTPGTLYLDCSADRRVMYIHTMYLQDIERFRQSIKAGFERRLLEILR